MVDYSLTIAIFKVDSELGNLHELMEACLAGLRPLGLPFAADVEGSRVRASVSGGAIGVADGPDVSQAFCSASTCRYNSGQ